MKDISPPKPKQARDARQLEMKTSYNFLAPETAPAEPKPRPCAWTGRLNAESHLEDLNAGGRKHVETWLVTESWKSKPEKLTHRRGFAPSRNGTLQIFRTAPVEDQWKDSAKRNRVNTYMGSKGVSSAVFSAEKKEREWEKWDGKARLTGVDIVKQLGKKSFQFYSPSHKFAIGKDGSKCYYL